MKCLVSGATGFIGRALCQRLSAGKIPFVALSRRGHNLDDGHVSIPLDLALQPVDDALFSGVDVVFHLAGIAHQNAEPGVYEQVNYRATLDLAAAACAAGVKTFIYLSSIKAMGLPAGNEARTEDQCVSPTDAYGRSKRRAELDLQATYADAQMSVVIVRPALVYGAGAGGNLQLLAAAVRAGLPRPPELGGRSMIALQDLVHLLQRLAFESGPGVHIWIACDDNAYTAGQIYDLMRTALGKKATRSWLPLPAWRMGCALRDLLARSAPGLTFTKIFGTELYSSAALREAHGWRPELSLADSVAEIMNAAGQTQKKPG